MQVQIKEKDKVRQVVDIKAVEDNTKYARMTGTLRLVCEDYSEEGIDDWMGQTGGLSHIEHREDGKMYAVYFAGTEDETEMRIAIDSGDVMVFIDDED